MKRIILLCLITMLSSVATATVAEEGFHAEKLPALDAEIAQAITDSKIVGGVLWVERAGVSYHKAFGNRALKPDVEPMTEDTIFDVASITKVVATGSAAMLCVERGLMNVDDPVSKHLPEFTGEGREKINLRHLLLHTAGLQVNLNGTKPPFSSNPDEAFAQACREKPLFEPGSEFSYSSVGTMVLGMVIERVTGRKIDEFCASEVFRPLKMNDTQFRPSGVSLGRVAPSSAPERGLVDDTVARHMGGIASHASLFTTAPDLARFARMMLNGGELDGVRVFKPETIKLMTSVQSPPNLRNHTAGNLPVRRGLGWDIDTPYRTQPQGPTLSTLHRGAIFPVGGYGHTGWTGQMLWIDPFSKTFVIFLCNRYGPEGKDTRPDVYQLHHRLSTLAAEAVKDFDFKNMEGALPKNSAAIPSTKDQPFTNSLGMKFVPVPGTDILMCIHETRRADYATYAATNSAADASWKSVVMENIPVGAGEDEPAVNVSWDDAKAFCEWLSKKEGRTYRLPLDREWSVAVGIGIMEAASGATPESLSAKIKDLYPWGRQWPPAKGAGNYAEEDCRKKIKSEKTMEGYADGFAVTAPVMSFPPNELGIHDLGGNVWEWCEDWFNTDKKLHILRGASWGSSAPEPLLSSFRAPQTADRRWRCNGFRCVLVVEPEEKADEPKKPRKIAHGGCYYPFPVKVSEPKEPLAQQFSLDRSAEYLDGLTRQWTDEVGCVSCHTTFSYVSSRPALKNVSDSSMGELQEFMQYRAANWKSDKPLWDAEVLITATSLAVYDSNTTGKLQPRTRDALETMWGLQRQDGAWNWLKNNTPPVEHDDYYGAVLVAVGVGCAPEGYATEDPIKDGMAKLRQYFANTPPPNLHHAAWLIWAEAKLGGVMPQDVRDQKIKELAALQKPDGGWSLPSLGGWKGHDGLPIDQAPSDGYATGLIVFALRQAGLPRDHDAVRKGVEWLKANQRESGSWFTGSLGTHYHLNFMSHSGTAFAVMALKACE